MIFKTVLGKLVEANTDVDGYTTYVFKDIDKNYDEYYMMVRYPKWDAPKVQLGAEGYVKFAEVQAGIDQWFDGTKFNKYRYDDIIFYKFIEKGNEQTNELFL